MEESNHEVGSPCLCRLVLCNAEEVADGQSPFHSPEAAARASASHKTRSLVIGWSKFRTNNNNE